jgi:hypothetical protein
MAPGHSLRPQNFPHLIFPQRPVHEEGTLGSRKISGTVYSFGCGAATVFFMTVIRNQIS